MLRQIFGIATLLVSSHIYASSMNSYVVKIKPGQEKYFEQKLQSTGIAAEYRKLKTLGSIYEVESSRSILGLRQSLGNDASVMIIEENFEIKTLSEPMDPKFEISWGLKNLGNNEPRRGGGRIPIPGVVGADSKAIEAWDLTKGSRDIKIAIIDTGIDYNHPDLRDNIWRNPLEAEGTPGVDDDGNGYVDDIHGYDVYNGDSDPMDDNFHGTHCAGIIGAAHNDIGIPGVMAEVSLVAIKFADRKGRGNLSTALEALGYAVTIGADIVNNSWGMRKHSQIMEDLFTEAADNNIIFIAAAGNSRANNDRDPKYPAAYPNDNLITVAAYSPEDRMTGFSSYGPISTDVAAPGRNIVSTIPNGSYKVLSGTSMSAPYVSGAIGLYLTLSPGTHHTRIAEDLIQSVVVSDHFVGKIKSDGRMDIHAFLQRAD